jgi:hypothetical protein
VGRHDQSPPEKFWKTLVADRDSNGRKLPSYFQLACRYAFDGRATGGDLSTSELPTRGKCPTIVTEFLSVVWDRALILSNGPSPRVTAHSETRAMMPLLGLVPGKARRGDLICILYGCGVPAVLRKKPDHKAVSFSSRASTWSACNPSLARRWTSAPQDSTNGMARSPGAQANVGGSNGTINRTSPAQSEAVVDSGGRSNTEEIGEDSQFVFIGECYIHGMMDGKGCKILRKGCATDAAARRSEATQAEKGCSNIPGELKVVKEFGQRLWSSNTHRRAMCYGP